MVPELIFKAHITKLKIIVQIITLCLLKLRSPAAEFT